MEYKLGDYYVQCARSGRKSRRSDCVKEWTGQLVRKEYSEQRHSLDFQRAPRAEQVVHDAQPLNEIELSYGDVTADDL